MALIKGKWLFKSTITPSEFEENVTFTSSGFTVTKVIGTSTGLKYTFEDGTTNSVYGSIGWEDSNARSVNFGDEGATVSQTFYDWFTANAEEVTDTTTTKIKGKWIFDDVPMVVDGDEYLDDRVVNVNYTSNGEEFIAIGINSPTNQLVYSYDLENHNYVYTNASGWSKEEYKTIDFGEGQAVDPEFYNWMFDHAIEVTPTTMLYGKWEFKSTITPSEFEEDVTFTSSGLTVTKVTGTSTGLKYTFEDGTTMSVYGSLGWEDSNARDVNFGDEGATVSQTFYDWFTENATEVAGITTTKTVKGVWTFNEYPDMTDILEYVDFTYVTSDSDIFQGEAIQCSPDMIYYYKEGIDQPQSVYEYSGLGWGNRGYKTIDFGETAQEVSDEFYSWLTANATRVSDSDCTPDDGHVDISGDNINVTLTSKNGIKLLTKGKLADKDIVVVPVLEDKTFKANGTYTASAGHAGFGTITVAIDADGGTVLATQEKTVYANGDVTPDAGYDALSKVTVAIPVYEGDHEVIN
jgi:hypothetical protein